MAKETKTLSFRNATIDLSDMTITEYNKEETKTYSLMSVLQDWNGLTGISLILKLDEEIGTVQDL